MTKKQQILKLYNDKKNWRPPSYQWVADRVGCVKSFVARCIAEEKLDSSTKSVSK